MYLIESILVDSVHFNVMQLFFNLLVYFLCLVQQLAIIVNAICLCRNEKGDTDGILQNTIRSLKENVDENSLLHIEVRRDFFLQDTLREAQKNKFNPSKFIKVASHLLDKNIYAEKFTCFIVGTERCCMIFSHEKILYF